MSKDGYTVTEYGRATLGLLIEIALDQNGWTDEEFVSQMEKALGASFSSQTLNALKNQSIREPSTRSLGLLAGTGFLKDLNGKPLATIDELQAVLCERIDPLPNVYRPKKKRRK